MSREQYIRWLKDDLDRLNALAAGWAEDARCARVDLRYACERQLERLRAHRERAAAWLIEAQATPEDAWERAALGIERAWSEMRDAYGAARMYFEPEQRAPRLLAPGLMLLALAGAAHAEQPTERYAPLQLQMARQSLARARALPAGETALAAGLARQALLDAHLAYRMTESRSLQREAAGVADESARLARSLEEGGS